MVLGLALAVAAMGFAVAMPLAVQSFTQVTSEHRSNRVAETDPSPEPLVTPDISDPEVIVLPEPVRKPEQKPEAAGSSSGGGRQERGSDGEAVRSPAEPMKKAKENHRGGNGKGKALGHEKKGPKDKDPEPGPPVQPQEPKEPKGPTEPEAPPAAEPDDSPGNSGGHGGGQPEDPGTPVPAPVEDGEEDGTSHGKGKGKGKAAGLRSTLSNSASTPATTPGQGNKKN